MPCRKFAAIAMSLALLFNAAAFGAEKKLEDWGEIETEVPGFDLAVYVGEFGEMARQYPRQWASKNDAALKQMTRYLQNYDFPLSFSKEAARDGILKNIRQMTQLMSQWDNAIVPIMQDGNLKVEVPSGKEFLAGVADQPFVLLCGDPGEKGIPVIRSAEANLRASDEIAVRVDPEHFTLVRLSLSGIKQGTNDCRLRLIDPAGADWFRSDLSLTGIAPGHLRIEVVDEATGEPTEVLAGLRTAHLRDCPPNSTPYYVHDHIEYWRPA